VRTRSGPPPGEPRIPSLLTFEKYGAGIGSAATVLRANATSARMDAPVPTCPGWSVTDLVAHEGMVHRWAADTLRGVRSDPADHEAAGQASADLLQWFDDGATELLDVLSKTPEGWDGWFFLPTATRPREGWARRQCHETTIHAVDAMAARLGRPPTSDEVWFDKALAVDGIDELLTGFVPRESSPLRSPQPVTIELCAEDVEATWTVTVADGPPSVARGAAAAGADTVWRASARDLYLALWNRGGDLAIRERTPAGRAGRRLWTGLMRVTWS
jgi:uncharacterized protein (TIGR03083 family)